MKTNYVRTTKLKLFRTLEPTDQVYKYNFDSGTSKNEISFSCFVLLDLVMQAIGNYLLPYKYDLIYWLIAACLLFRGLIAT